MSLKCLNVSGGGSNAWKGTRVARRNCGGRRCAVGFRVAPPVRRAVRIRWCAGSVKRRTEGRSIGQSRWDSVKQEEPVHGLWFHSWRDGISLDLVGERALVWCRPAVLLAHRRLKVIGCLWFDVLSLGVAVLSGVDLARTLRQKPRPHHQM